MYKNSQSQVGFSLPRAFQWWSRNCHSACGFFQESRFCAFILESNLVAVVPAEANMQVIPVCQIFDLNIYSNLTVVIVEVWPREQSCLTNLCTPVNKASFFKITFKNNATAVGGMDRKIIF